MLASVNSKPKQISRREIEIIAALSHGMSSQEISEKLFISVHTVDTHRRNIIQKIKAKNTAHLIRKSFELGLVQPYETFYIG